MHQIWLATIGWPWMIGRWWYPHQRHTYKSSQSSPKAWQQRHDGYDLHSDSDWESRRHSLVHDRMTDKTRGPSSSWIHAKGDKSIIHLLARTKSKFGHGQFKKCAKRLSSIPLILEATIVSESQRHPTESTSTVTRHTEHPVSIECHSPLEFFC